MFFLSSFFVCICDLTLKMPTTFALIYIPCDLTISYSFYCDIIFQRYTLPAATLTHHSRHHFSINWSRFHKLSECYIVRISGKAFLTPLDIPFSVFEASHLHFMISCSLLIRGASKVIYTADDTCQLNTEKYLVIYVLASFYIFNKSMVMVSAMHVQASKIV